MYVAYSALFIYCICGHKMPLSRVMFAYWAIYWNFTKGLAFSNVITAFIFLYIFYILPFPYTKFSLLFLIKFRYDMYQTLNIFINMPQLVPFYFINQVIFAFTLLTIIIYVFSKYVLPRFVRLFLTRVFISKL